MRQARTYLIVIPYGVSNEGEELPGADKSYWRNNCLLGLLTLKALDASDTAAKAASIDVNSALSGCSFFY